MSALLTFPYAIEESMDVKKWEQLGFLQGLNDSLKNKCAHAYEMAGKILLKKDEKDELVYSFHSKTAVFIFPAIRRCISNPNGDESLLDEFQFTNEKILELLELLDFNVNFIELNEQKFSSKFVDVEAHLVKTICDMFISQENNKIKYNNQNQ